MGRYSKNIDFEHGKIDLTHGSGGRNMAELIDALFVSSFNNPALNERNDQALLNIPQHRIVITTDAHVVSPMFFPGGDIGSLSVHGTINDVAMSGAEPVCLSSAFIIEEGFSLKDLKRIVSSMALAAEKAHVPIVTGDTKVVEKGKGDGVFITTTGIGVVPDGVSVSWRRISPGDAIILSGTMGDHGSAIMVARNQLKLESELLSDSAALHDLVKAMIHVVPDIHCMRDPTRGGISAVLNELALESGLNFLVEEKDVPIREDVKAISEILGIDPCHMANEGKLIAFCATNDAQSLLKTMKNHPLGKNASIIGRVLEKATTTSSTSASFAPRVEINTLLGGRRVLQWISGEQLPRIC